MAHSKTEEQVPEPLRKEIFQALVEAQEQMEAQEQKVDVVRSRKLVAERFSINDNQVRQIEREGIEKQWPPL